MCVKSKSLRRARGLLGPRLMQHVQRYFSYLGLTDGDMLAEQRLRCPALPLQDRLQNGGVFAVGGVHPRLLGEIQPANDADLSVSSR